MKKHVEVSFNADLKNVVFSRGVVASFFLEEETNLNIINEVKTIVSEAVTNAIVHGYGCDNTKNVKMVLELEGELLKIEVEDEGVGIENVEEAKQPLFSTKKSEERAGLGFTIMDIFSDSMEVTSKKDIGTKLLIYKDLD